MSTTPPAEDAAKGAKRRSGIPTLRAPVATTTTARPPLPQQADVQRLAAEDSGRDSGLSSECTTPTNGSPPPREVKAESQPSQPVSQIPRRKMVDIIAASKARLQESARLNSNNRTTRLLNSRSSSESPRSLDSRRTQVFQSPLRTPRNLQSPSIDSGDEGSLRIERGSYNYMFQDIVSIKTMLLKLKRVLQESGENGLTRSETLNPFDNTLKNGLFYNLNDGNTTTDGSLDERQAAAAAVADELADLRRQVVFLQGQVDDKDRTIKSLEAQLAKYQSGKADLSPTSNAEDEAKELCNAATQTEKLRPVSMGSSILQSHTQDNGMGSLVSWNDSWNGQQSPSSQRRTSGSLGGGQSEQNSPHNSLSNGKLTTPSSTSSSRRSSSDSSPQPAPRPNSLRGLKPPNGFAASPPGSPKTRSAIPTPRSRLATPTLIPRAARAVSATGRAHNT